LNIIAIYESEKVTDYFTEHIQCPQTDAKNSEWHKLMLLMTLMLAGMDLKSVSYSSIN